MTIIFAGILSKARAPVEVTTIFSSISIPGRAEGSDPLAIIICLAVYVSSPIRISPTLGIDAQPFNQSILFFLNKNSMPLVFPSITSDLYPCILFQSTEGLSAIRPIFAKLCCAS